MSNILAASNQWMNRPADERFWSLGANILAASNQWMNRPADERFWSLGAMRQSCEASRARSATATVPFGKLAVESDGQDIALLGPSGARATMTHYAFGQIAASAGAPASYLRELPAPVAASALNASLARHADTSDRNLLFHKDGEALTLRAALSEKYDRVWDSDVCAFLERMNHLQEETWKAPAGLVPPGYKGATRAATAADILPGQINIRAGMQIAPSGLYASDHDMFAFLIAPDRVISDGTGELMRGIMVKNSEVGDASLSVTFFLCKAVCGNHIIWNATGVHEIRVRHVGERTLSRAFRGFSAELRRYHDAAPEEEKGIAAARNLILGNTKEDVLTAIVKYAKTHSIPLPRTRIVDALRIAEENVDIYGDPRSLWGVVSGLTQGSQAGGYADDRAAIDRAAGKLMQLVF